MHLIFEQYADELQVRRVIVDRHHAHGQLVIVTGDGDRVVINAAIFRQCGQQARGGEWF
ncbi:hypothetical protein D3C76_1807900 [compost metagenome]